MIFFGMIMVSFVFSAQAQSNVWSIQKDVAFLSSDLTEGRMTGSKGERLSAQYIAERYTQIGLTPKGTEGFLPDIFIQTTCQPA